MEEVKDRQCPVSGGIGLRPDLEVVAEQDDRGPPGNYQVREHLA